MNRVLETGAPDAMALQKYDIPVSGGFEERYWSPLNSPVLDGQGRTLYIIHRVEDVTEFVRIKERGAALKTKAEQMEVEVFHRAQEIQKTNDQLRATNTALEKKEQEIHALFDKLRDLDKLKSEFFANVSHELRTPLTLLLGPMEKRLAAPNLPPEEKRDFELMARNARVLLKHVTDLLDASKLESGKMEARYEDLDLAGLARRVAGQFDSLAREKKIALALDMPGTLLVQADPAKIERVILNLVSNAFKFTPDGGKIRCALAARGLRAALQVADSGPGIPEDKREAVFERFRQLDGGTTRRFGGTGLGLAIARDFIALHGGALTVSDAPEGGALLTAELPRRAPAGTVLQQTQEDQADRSPVSRAAVDSLRNLAEAPGPDAGPDKPLVLVVEDNGDMRQFIRDCLAKEFRTAEATDGQRGLEMARALKPDLVLSDVMMPVMGGPALLRALQARGETAKIPVLLLTAKTDEEMRINLLRQGAQDYLNKPFFAEELLARVKNLARCARDQEDLRRHADRLVELNRELEAFSYSVSHDLRAPLRGVDGFSRILMEDYAGVLDDKGKETLARVRAAAKRMNVLIDALLDLSRITRQDVRAEKVDLTALAREILGLLAEDEPQRRVDATVPDGLMAEADGALLRVVLDNLLRNAWKFTAKTADARIEVGQAGTEEGKRVFFVRDNGAGFDPAHATKLFGVFQRFHGQDEFPGTGIGLATVHRILRRLEGRIWAEAAPGKGATFYFTLKQAS